MKSIISSKGRITVPADLCERLGLVPGTVVLFGTLSLPRPVDALIDEMRGHRRRVR